MGLLKWSLAGGRPPSASAPGRAEVPGLGLAALSCKEKTAKKRLTSKKLTHSHGSGQEA